MAKEKVSLDDKIWAAAGYLWILSLVALAARKENKYIRFHASQGLMLFVISLIVFVIPILWFINIIIVIISIFAIIKAISGIEWKLPLLGNAPQTFADWVIKKIKL